jgi:hypothetical protein
LTFNISSDNTPPTCMNVDICASYAKADGTPQIIQTSATKLPLSMLMHTTREESEGEVHSIGFDFAGNYNDTVRAFLPGTLNFGFRSFPVFYENQ